MTVANDYPFAVMGVDPGVTTGFAIIDCLGPDEWRLATRWEHRGDNDLTRGEQLESLYDDIWIHKNGIAAITMESFLAYGTNTAEEKVEAQAIVKLVAAIYHLPLFTYAPVTVRNAVCGHGKATAAEIRQILRNLLRMGRTSRRGEAFTAHQQDAVAVALCYLLRENYLKALNPMVTA